MTNITFTNEIDEVNISNDISKYYIHSSNLEFSNKIINQKFSFDKNNKNLSFEIYNKELSEKKQYKKYFIPLTLSAYTSFNFYSNMISGQNHIFLQTLNVVIPIVSFYLISKMKLYYYDSYLIKNKNEALEVFQENENMKKLIEYTFE